MTWSLEKHIYRNMSIPQRLFRGCIPQSSDTKPESAVFKPEKRSTPTCRWFSPSLFLHLLARLSPPQPPRPRAPPPRSRRPQNFSYLASWPSVVQNSPRSQSTDSLAIDALAFCIYEILTTYIKILTLAVQV